MRVAFQSGGIVFVAGFKETSKREAFVWSLCFATYPKAAKSTFWFSAEHPSAF